MSLAKSIVFSQRLKNVTVDGVGQIPSSSAEMKAAMEKSFQEGFQAASDKFNAQILQMRQQMQAHAEGILKKVEDAHTHLTEAINAQLPELISAGVWKIVGQDAMPVEILKSRVETIVKESCPSNEPVEVKMNPADLAEFEKVDADYMAKHPRLKFKGDETLARGDCVMETKFGQVDATLKTQLRRLVEELQNV